MKKEKIYEILKKVGDKQLFPYGETNCMVVTSKVIEEIKKEIENESP